MPLYHSPLGTFNWRRDGLHALISIRENVNIYMISSQLLLLLSPELTGERSARQYMYTGLKIATSRRLVNGVESKILNILTWNQHPIYISK